MSAYDKAHAPGSPTPFSVRNRDVRDEFCRRAFASTSAPVVKGYVKVKVQVNINANTNVNKKVKIEVKYKYK